MPAGAKGGKPTNRQRQPDAPGMPAGAMDSGAQEGGAKDSGKKDAGTAGSAPEPAAELMPANGMQAPVG